MKIKWTNTYSRDTGFIKYIDYKNKHFVNTFNEGESKNLFLQNLLRRLLTN